MKNIRQILLCLFILQYMQAAERESFHYYFSHITGENGLSQSNVKAIIQDSYGFMWFGTKNGLNRYDGTSIRTMDCDDPIARKGDHNISALYEDAERRLWVGTDKGVYLYNPVTEVFTFLDILSDEGLQMSNWVSEIQSDLSGNIWIVIPNQGVFRYKDKKLYHYYITEKENYNSDNPECICVRKNGEVWVGVNRAGLFLYEAKTDSFRQYITDKDGNSLKGENIYSICEYGDCIVVAVHEGELKKFNISANTLSNVHAPGVHYSLLRDVVCYDDRLLWVGTQAGLFVIDESENKVIHIGEDSMHPYGLSDKAVFVIYKDREEGMWLGTLFGGVNYLPGRKLAFEKYVPLSSPHSLSSKRIRELTEDASGQIWVGTEDGGLNVLDPKTGWVKQIGQEVNRKNNRLNTLAVCANPEEIWCGLFKKGMDIVHLPSHTVTHYSGKELNLEEESVYALCRDRQGQTWLGNAWGLSVAAPGSKHFERVEQLGYFWVYDIFEEKEGSLWIASMGRGVYRYDPSTGSFTHYMNEPGNRVSLSSNSVSGIMQDSKGSIWFSTDRGGICRYNRETDDFTTYSIKDGFPDDVAYTILEDRQGNLWFGTNRGLVKFNPDTKAVRVYTRSDGLLGNQFNYKSALKSTAGKFYFGSIDGLIAFDPEQTVESDFTPPVYITRFSIYDKEIRVNTAHSPLTKSIIVTDKIELSHDQSNLSFDFVALSYAAPEANQYTYRMDPVDKNWIRANSNHTITYSKLPPGKYTLYVQAANDDTVWKQAGTSLDIVILPPWWASRMAYLIYVIIVVCFIGSAFCWYKRKKDRQMKENLKLFEIKKEKELYSAKIEFFTEIAHEVRTPLTLINGPLESILEMDIKDAKITHNLQVMAQNTKRLLELTRQLLDFRKVGASKFLMDFVMVDITRLLTETVSRFEPTILQQKKEVSLHIPEADFRVAIDKEAVTKILSNLLSNALKYSFHAIDVELIRERTSFSIRVTSDGDRIPSELGQRIFEPFYQIHTSENSASGAGIGLPLARSLAELHQGHLVLDTQAALNTFILTLPLHQEKVIYLEDNAPEDEYIRPEEAQEAAADISMKECTLLLVEDNESMQSFIAEKLQNTFTVETALNGLEALEILKSRSVDLVISDIMMPQMDGMELCRTVKQDMELSHIPFIFLTAKNDLESKINGLKAGAEAYVEKPFSFSYLRTQILSLLNNRRKEREAFSKRPFFPVQNMKMNKADEAFMDKIIGIIHENISDENFNVERLAEILCMSRSSLLRKIKVLSNLSPVDFIKLIRLKKAAELILERKYRIGEICEMVGINSPSYFSKLFLKQFGVTPKDFEKQNQLSFDALILCTPNTHE